jgi:hypothetical protein
MDDSWCSSGATCLPNQAGLGENWLHLILTGDCPEDAWILALPTTLLPAVVKFAATKWRPKPCFYLRISICFACKRLISSSVSSHISVRFRRTTGATFCGAWLRFERFIRWNYREIRAVLPLVFRYLNCLERKVTREVCKSWCAATVLGYKLCSIGKQVKRFEFHLCPLLQNC